jgi:hypothetical protein
MRLHLVEKAFRVLQDRGHLGAEVQEASSPLKIIALKVRNKMRRCR